MQDPSKSPFSFGRFGEDPVDDARKLALIGAALALIGAGVFFMVKSWDGWELYGKPLLNWGIGLLAAAILIYVFQRNFQTFGAEVVTELKRVTWPTWEEAKKNTMLVLSVMLIFSIIVFAYDQVFGFLLSRGLKLYSDL